MFKQFTPKTIEYVDTPKGKLRGYKLDDVYAFLGVQYGEAERWQMPTPTKPWKGVKNALQFGNRAFPFLRFTPWDSCGVAHEAYSYSEDCLNLNIWTPSIDSKAKKPVMVWIHGGGYATGSSMEMQGHEGSNLSRFGDVVVVTINHRLNIFGFFDMSDFGEKYYNSENVGLGDLVMALSWVKENIACFGGDPDNVMIFGQSGGGGKVRALMQTPAADGLYHKAVIMSGTGFGGGPEEKESPSRLVREKLMEELNTNSIEPLLELTPEELLEKSMRIVNELKEKFGFLSWRPAKNDWYLGEALTVGLRPEAGKIPVMLGSTISEGPLMRIFNKHDYTVEQQEQIVREAFPEQDADKLMELFRKAWPDKCVTDAIEITGNLNFRPGDIAYSDLRAECAEAPTWVYIFGHDFPQDGGRGAWHCADIPIVFHNAEMYPDNYKDGLMDGLQDAISGSWVAFAHNSDPNNKFIGIEWPEYKKGQCAIMVFDNQCRVGYDFDRELIAYRNSLKLKIDDKYTKFQQLIN